ncbi:MAG: PAS domain S-box protein [bacterium]
MNFSEVSKSVSDLGISDENQHVIISRVMDRMDTIFYLTDLDGKIVYVNSGFVKATGFSADEAVGSNARILKSGEMPVKYYKNLWTTLLEGKKWKEEIVNKKKNGEYYYAIQEIRPLKSEKDIILGFAAFQIDITLRKQIELMYENKTFEYETIFDHTLDAVFLVDVDEGPVFRFRRLNSAHEKSTGLTTETVRGRRPVEVLGEKLGEEVNSNYRKCWEAGQTVKYEEYLDLPAGGRYWITNLHPVYNHGRIVNIVGVSRDITEEKKLRSQRDMFFDVSTDMVCITTVDGKFIQVGSAWEKTLGWPKDQLEGYPYLSLVHPEDREKTVVEMSRLAEGKEVREFDNRYRCADGTYRWLSWNSRMNDDSGLVFAVARDIHDRKKMEKELLRLSITDSLTGLYNRKKMYSEMEKETERYKRYGHVFSIIMFDVDHFKKVNDNYGHDTGDKVLISISEKTEQLLRKTDMIARWGGEEFMVLLRDTALEGAVELAERMRKSIRDIDIENLPGVTVSLGVVSRESGGKLEDLLKKVDNAMYRAKNNGRDCVVRES